MLALIVFLSIIILILMQVFDLIAFGFGIYSCPIIIFLIFLLFLEKSKIIPKKKISPNIFDSIDWVLDAVLFPLKWVIPYLYTYLNDFANLNIIKRTLVSSAKTINYEILEYPMRYNACLYIFAFLLLYIYPKSYYYAQEIYHYI